MAVQVVVLAAGKGSRMQSNIPKVLHHLAGKPLLSHVLETTYQLNPTIHPIVVYGHQGNRLKADLGHFPVQWVEQEEQLGTGHALQKALPFLNQNADQVLVLYGDVPLISKQTLQKMIDGTPSDAVSLLTATLHNPTGYGRIKRNERGQIIAIVEQKDATESELAIQEINPGIYCLPVTGLKDWLPQLKTENLQFEYYLTDVIRLAQKTGVIIHSFKPDKTEEILGVNDLSQLAFLERYYQSTLAHQYMLQGVAIRDPNRFDCRGELEIGQDVTIDLDVIFEGRVTIGNHCLIGPHCIIKNTTIGDGVEIKANSIIDGAEIASGCSIGPFARIRPGTCLENDVHIGNFVELKNTLVDQASKINHLSYVGDSEIGKRVNIGAGTITCNYDGLNKHKTIIGDDVHIGSDTQLVAPVTIGAGATLGAGSTVIKDVPAQELTLTHRIEQRVVKNWRRPSKKNEKEKEKLS